MRKIDHFTSLTSKSFWKGKKEFCVFQKEYMVLILQSKSRIPYLKHKQQNKGTKTTFSGSYCVYRISSVWSALPVHTHWSWHSWHSSIMWALDLTLYYYIGWPQGEILSMVTELAWHRASISHGDWYPPCYQVLCSKLLHCLYSQIPMSPTAWCSSPSSSLYIEMIWF